jgi:hypothetical protein
VVIIEYNSFLDVYYASSYYCVLQVVIIEYNSFLDAPALKVQGAEMGGGGGTVFFGAGLGALAHLGVRLGYTLGRNSGGKKI